MSSFDLARQSQAFRFGYWDALAGRSMDHMPPYAEQSTRYQYIGGYLVGRSERNSEAA